MEANYQKLLNFTEKLKRNPIEKRLHNYFNQYNILHQWNYIISPYIVDFFFLKKGLVFELDGSIHNNINQQNKDMVREDYLLSFDLLIMRFKSTDDFKNILNTYHKFKKISYPKRKKLIDKICRARSFFNLPREFKQVPYNFNALYGWSKEYKRKKNTKKRRISRQKQDVPK
jgi:very-short-patch-repair endonuclease